MTDTQDGPHVRLVANANQGREEAKVQALQPPSIRLAWFDIPAVNNTLDRAPTVRLAHQPGSQCDNSIKEGGWNNNGAPLMPTQKAPALLVSYYYLKPFLENRELYHYRDWVLDSGAFSAHNSGVNIDLNQYIDCCLSLMSTDPRLTEVFALDVIPKDHQPLTVQKAAEQSLKNTEEMWRQGVPAIPTFHRGEDESFLYQMAREYPKIGIGGVALLRGDQKFLFCEQVFARVWPKRIHGLGMAAEKLVYGLPFHSVDATNWEMAPCAFGNWQKFGKMSVRGSDQDLRSQVYYYLELEAKARVRWAAQMKELDAADKAEGCTWKDKLGLRPTGHQSVRLAVDASSGNGKRIGTTIAKDPEVLLALANAGKERISKGIGKKKEKAPAPTPVPAQPVAEPVQPKRPAVLEDNWVDYWKNRFSEREPQKQKGEE